VKEYSPKRRTAVVFTGSGTTGAYHAGAMKALDECGVKLDLVVGSGMGTVAAALAAVMGGAKLYGPGGFWDGVSFASFYRLRPAVATAVALLGAAFGVFLLPIALALVVGLLFPLVLIVDLVVPGTPARLLTGAWAVPDALAGPYLATLAIPIFALSILAVAFVLLAWLKDRRRFAEAFESILSARPGEERLRRALWETARGAARGSEPPSEAVLGERYVALLAENLGQPGFRELILRAANLDTGRVLPFAVLEEAHRRPFLAAQTREGTRVGHEGQPGAVDLRTPGYEALLFEAAAAGLLPSLTGPVRRVAFPRGGLHAGETHRVTEATLLGGCGISEAVAAGAEQVIVVSGTPEASLVSSRRRGARARINATLAALERAAVDRELAEAERLNRVVETLGHRTGDGGRAWQDPATGRVYKDVALYVVRPARRSLMPLELDGARDPATDVVESVHDLVQRGYEDTYRLFVEPVVGAAPPPSRDEAEQREEGQPLEL
jgi:antitoxin (DNA-binding transcriptional repressor) of toxin-antitoxin stability system